VCRLTGFKAARRAARAAASARSPPLPLALPLRRRQRRSAGAKAKDLPGHNRPESLGAAADLTREPSRWPRSGQCGQTRSQPDRQDSVRAIAPCQIRRSVLSKLIRRRPYLLTLA